MAYKACPNCGCRVYSLGCMNCDEEAYIAEQAAQGGYSWPPLHCPHCDGGYVERAGTGDNMDADPELCEFCRGTGLVR